MNIISIKYVQATISRLPNLAASAIATKNERPVNKVNFKTLSSSPLATIIPLFKDIKPKKIILVGDSAGNNFFAEKNTIPVTVDELLPLTRAVARSVKQALVVADLPFGSYESGPDLALATSIRFFKEAGAHAVKLEGAHVDSIKKLVSSGIPVMGHIGLTPQSVHQLGGFKVQGRENPDALIEAAKAIEAAGAFAIVLEMVPEDLAGTITKELSIPTIGIGAGNQTDAQVLVWTDAFGLTKNPPKLARAYRNLRQQLLDGAKEFAADVASQGFPSDKETFK